MIKVCVIIIFMPIQPTFSTLNTILSSIGWNLSTLPTMIWTPFRDKQALFRAAGWRQHHITKNKLKVEPKFPVILPGDHTEVLHVQLSMFSKQSRCLFKGLYYLNKCILLLHDFQKQKHTFIKCQPLLISQHINHNGPLVKSMQNSKPKFK